ncbi:MAG: hypothetical protein HKN21_07185, partial [Candidatus Eisenbacteria bacterium]|nr:hypothetical protein [Candidatus Eisenbacteria bacterium]
NEVIVGPLSMVMIDHKKEEAFKTTYAELKAMMSGMSDAMEQMAAQAKKAMEEAKKGMTEEQIKAMEQYMPDLDAEIDVAGDTKPKKKFSYKHKGGDGKVAGHSVSRTEVFEDGKLVGKIWTTKDIPFTAVTNAIDNIVGIMPGSAIKGNAEFMSMLEDLNGFPLKFHHVEDNATFEAVRVDEKNFSAKDWESPYPTKSMMEMMQGGGMGSHDDDDGGW